MSSHERRTTGWRADVWWVLYQHCPRRLRRLERWFHDRLISTIAVTDQPISDRDQP